MEYVETVYDESNGMITSEANAVLQDQAGYIWIGSYGGLSRYTGHEFENMSLYREGAPKSAVRVLFQDSTGRIWIGTNDSGLYLFEDETFFSIAEKSGSSQFQAETLSVRTIVECPDNHILIGTTNGLFLVDDEYRIAPLADDRMAGETVRDLISAQDGTVWGVTSAGHLFTVSDQIITSVYDPALFPVPLSGSLFQTTDGSIYLGTDDNLVFRVDPTQAGRELQPVPLSLGGKETVNDMYQDQQGKLWVCTDNGIGYFGQNDTFYEIHGLSSDTIMTQMCEDYEGNLWFASSRRGLFELSRSKFRNVGYEAGVNGLTVNSTVLYRNSLYIGTDSGLFLMDEDGLPVANDLTQALEGIRIRNLMCDSRGNLWISTYKSYGLICYQGATGEWASFTQENGMPHNQVRMALELSNGDIAAATNGGVAILRNGTVKTTFTSKDGLQNETILCLAEGSGGALLAGSDGNGIYQVDLETRQIQNFTTQDGLASGVILRMVADPAIDGIWISNGSGLNLWQGGDLRSIPGVEAGTGSIFDIKLTEDHVWLLKSFGAIRITREDLIAGNPVYQEFARKDGLTSSITANSWNYLGPAGLMFLCTANGVYYMDINQIYKNTSLPKIAVSNIAIDDTVYYGAQDLVIPSDTQRITIHMDLLSFGFASGTLEYYLSGFDKAPILVNSKSENQISYTNLPGGSYTFHLRGYNADGTESEELTFRIQKELSLFERRTVYIWLGMGGLLLVLLAVVVAQYLNKKRILKRQKAYQELTDQTIRIVAKTIDAKDKYTIGHSNRVAVYAAEIGRRFGLPKEQMEQLRYSALLHDIGKIGIPDHILNKAGKLTDEEYAAIKRHPAIGGEILKDFTLIPWIRDGAQYHHERFDGRGYNSGLKGEEIPLYARIIAVADAYDCMNSTRIYRPNLTPEVIYQEIEKGKGSQFDPVFADIMLEMMKDGFEA